jgi:hypothetical protein
MVTKPRGRLGAIKTVLLAFEVIHSELVLSVSASVSGLVMMEMHDKFCQKKKRAKEKIPLDRSQWPCDLRHDMFESHSRHGRPSAFILCLCCPV